MSKKEVDEGIEKRILNTLNHLKEQGLTSEEIIGLANKLLEVPVKEEVKIPISVFKNDHLSALETIVKYLRENLLLSFRELCKSPLIL